ncbi:MAG: DUF1998 domain-containing protein [Azoarcus sp.]|jgi:hypothetical protein|nr:DUF1998 domain-containing protein [Azoarcus sp.]
MKRLPIRLSHLLRHSGVGAIMRGPEGLAVIQDIRQWTDPRGQTAGEIIHYVERVRSALGIEQSLREPPLARETERGGSDGVCIPATRFPFWMRCPHCGKLYYKPWRAQKNDSPRCDCDKRSLLEQLAWVLVDPAGYLTDVPWRNLAHRDAAKQEQRQCKIGDKLYLIERQGQYVLQCKACDAEKDFRGDERMGFGQQSMQPWTRETPPQETAQTNEAEPAAQILRINDVRVYSPVAERVLVIPPESRMRRGTVVDLLYRNSGDRDSVDNARTPLARKSALSILAEKYRCANTEIEQAFVEIERGYPLYGRSFTPGMLRESEYRAFLETLPDQRDDEDFVNRDRSADWQALCRMLESPGLRARVSPIRHLVRVDRLKAIQVFLGFRRMQGERVTPPDLVGQSDWLPAIPLYGEGIFLTLEETLLSRWEDNAAVDARTKQLLQRFSQSGREQPNPLTARFLLLHTLSHLLIRQLEAEGGYSAAALSERIYCSHAPDKMAGILLYVAVPDLAGSLGGLAELAEPRRFLGLLAKALEHARWCAFDPVCGEHEGQGPGLLNRAACHACALIPEPACDYGNTLLDRVFVKGDAASGFPSLFGNFS